MEKFLEEKEKELMERALKLGAWEEELKRRETQLTKDWEDYFQNVQKLMCVNSLPMDKVRTILTLFASEIREKSSTYFAKGYNLLKTQIVRDIFHDKKFKIDNKSVDKNLFERYYPSITHFGFKQHDHDPHNKDIDWKRVADWDGIFNSTPKEKEIPFSK